MKKQYNTPECDVTLLELDDVLTTSGWGEKPADTDENGADNLD